MIPNARQACVRKLQALSNTNTSNRLLATAPDLYLFGALAEAHGFVKETGSLALWKSHRDELSDELVAITRDRNQV